MHIRVIPAASTRPLSDLVTTRLRPQLGDQPAPSPPHEGESGGCGIRTHEDIAASPAVKTAQLTALTCGCLNPRRSSDTDATHPPAHTPLIFVQMFHRLTNLTHNSRACAACRPGKM